MLAGGLKAAALWTAFMCCMMVWVWVLLFMLEHIHVSFS